VENPLVVGKVMEKSVEKPIEKRIVEVKGKGESDDSS
jgi:hypothetical protein